MQFSQLRPLSKRLKQKPSERVIYLTQQVYQNYKESICQYPPETFALLGGRLDQPFTITDFRFCPPRKNKYGRYDHSATHVNVDHEYMNWVIDQEWRPNGKYILGIWHSHPAAVTSPSYGSPGSNEGDVVFFSSCMEHDDSPNRNWNTFIAPITTFDRNGNDLIHGWTLDKGSDAPISAKVQLIEECESIPQRDIQELCFLMRRRYENELHALSQSYFSSNDERRNYIAAFRTIRKKEIADIRSGRHPLVR